MSLCDTRGVYCYPPTLDLFQSLCVCVLSHILPEVSVVRHWGSVLLSANFISVWICEHSGLGFGNYGLLSGKPGRMLFSSVKTTIQRNTSATTASPDEIHYYIAN